MYGWFRLHSEARNDKKLATLTDAQHRVWFNLLCYASEQSHQRGAFECDDAELLAIEVSGGDTDLLNATLERLTRLRILARDGDTYAFINWDKRQYDKPSDTPKAVNGRVSRHRENKRGSTGSTAPESHTEAPEEAPSGHDAAPEELPETRRNAQKRDVTPRNAHTQTQTIADAEDIAKPNAPTLSPRGAAREPSSVLEPPDPLRSITGKASPLVQSKAEADRREFVASVLVTHPEWEARLGEELARASPGNAYAYAVPILRGWEQNGGPPPAREPPAITSTARGGTRRTLDEAVAAAENDWQQIAADRQRGEFF